MDVHFVNVIIRSIEVQPPFLVTTRRLLNICIIKFTLANPVCPHEYDLETRCEYHCLASINEQQLTS